jgi:hypothetical protein
MNTNKECIIYYATSESIAFCKYNIGNQEHTASATATATASALSAREAKAKSEEISAIRAEQNVREVVYKKSYF